MTKEQKQKLIKLRCEAWGITEDDYYCNRCSDFSLEDMARAYRRGKNKGRAELEKKNAELKLKLEALGGQTPWKDIKDKSELIGKLIKAKETLKAISELASELYASGYSSKKLSECIQDKIEQFLKEAEE